jgi:hypothetical protein
MSCCNDSEDRVAIVQMNAELRHAQLELLSAQCATDRVRLRFSIEDIARHAQPDVLRKALGTATALQNYYASIEKQRASSAMPVNQNFKLNEELVLQASERLSDYLRSQRDYYLPMGKPLTREHKATLEPFFSPSLLARARTVDLAGRRVPNPPFFAEAKAMGFANLPEVPHMPSITFVDVVVFNEKITERTLFHGLVHTVQLQVLGLERYTDIFVRGFVSRKPYFNVPLEAHAIALEAKFAGNPGGAFSVEEQVWLWLNQGRYLVL